MKTLKYKIVSLVVLFIAIGANAQKYDKKVTEKFKVNSDVAIVINASHTDIDVQTWNRNEVSIEAFIEVEGVDKEEANKIIKQWEFEALGNKSKVKISSSSNNMYFEFDGDFDFDFPEMEFELPEMNFVMPELPELPEMLELDSLEFVFPEIEFPEIEMEIEEFDYEEYKGDSLYLKKYKTRVAAQVEKFKNSDWKKKLDSTLSSDEFKRSIDSLKLMNVEVGKKLKVFINSEGFKQRIEESKRAAKEATKQVLKNKELIEQQTQHAKKAAAEAMKMVAEMKAEGKLNSSENVYFNSRNNHNSKVKIRKYIKVKVPKKATFDLNVRHGKLNIPDSNTKMSAKIFYGDFIAGLIEGAKNNLEFTNSPVTIETISASNITLKNVPNATFGTFFNNNLFSNSSNVIIDEVGEDVALSQKFGNIEVNSVVPNFKNMNVIFDYAKGTLNFDDVAYNFQINGKKSKIYVGDVLTRTSNRGSDEIDSVKGFQKDKNSSNKLFLTGVFSTIKIK